MTPKRMSILATNSLPPPPTRPSICAMVTLSILRSRSHIKWNGLDSALRSASPSMGNCKIASTSKCARKKSGFALLKTTTDKSGLRCRSSTNCISSAYRGRVIILIGGLSMTTVATLDVISTVNKLKSIFIKISSWFSFNCAMPLRILPP